MAEKPRKIIHIDMDCFYAAVEIRDNPALKGKPVAVGGRPDERGVLTTASYEARKFGLRSAMPSSRAVRMCPGLILLPCNFEKYRAESKKVRAIFGEYTAKIEPLSLDEAYLDVTDSPYCGGIASKIAAEIRARIFETTQLTASAGIAPNKFLAKVASDWKKPNGQFTVTPQMVPDFVKRLKVEKIPGVGRVTAKKMNELGLYTCADLQTWDMTRLQSAFGSWGVRLYDLARGHDDREVSDDGERKSISVENTYSRDLVTVEECVAKVPELFEDFTKRLEKAQAASLVKSLVVKIKFHDFKQTTLESSQQRRPSVEAFSQMVAKAFARGDRPVRLIGLGVRLHSEKSKPATPQLTLL
ncbi:MAG TPA: DNA polymerase IV [Bdellovibrionales bacterium]|nr:DNA polymerase IV [Bdellovibrionales bacterium]